MDPVSRLRGGYPGLPASFVWLIEVSFYVCFSHLLLIKVLCIYFEAYFVITHLYTLNKELNGCNKKGLLSVISTLMPSVRDFDTLIGLV